MVRVGGGWDTLENYLIHHRPVEVFEHKRLVPGEPHDVGNKYLYFKSKYKSHAQVASEQNGHVHWEMGAHIYTVYHGACPQLCIYTLYHGLVHWERYVNNVTWACPLRDESSLVYLYRHTGRNFLFIYSIDCCCIQFESGCACFWRNMGQRNAFTLFIKHLFCSQYLIELYLEFIGFLGLLLFSPIYSWLFKCICKGCEEFFLLGIICIYSAVVIVAQVTHSYLIMEKYSLSLYMYYIVYYFQNICTTKMHGLPFYYPYVLYQLATKTFCLWF